jgi:hypothetical protein
MLGPFGILSITTMPASALLKPYDRHSQFRTTGLCGTGDGGRGSQPRDLLSQHYRRGLRGHGLIQ